VKTESPEIDADKNQSHNSTATASIVGNDDDDDPASLEVSFINYNSFAAPKEMAHRLISKTFSH
jgi:hypothetical protein